MGCGVQQRSRFTSAVVSLLIALTVTSARGEPTLPTSQMSDVRTGRPEPSAATTPATPLVPTERSLASLLPLVTEEAIAGLVVYPGRFFQSDVARRLPVEIVTLDLEQRLGIDLRSVEFIVAFLEQDATVPLSVGWIVRFSDDYDWRRLPASLLEATVFGELDGQPYRRAKGALDLSCFALDSRTLLLATDHTLKRMLATRHSMPSDHSISQQLSQGIDKSLDVHLAVNTKPLRPLVALQLEQLHGEPGAWRGLAELIDHMERIELRARLCERLMIGVVLEASPDDSAADLQAFWDEWTESMTSRWDVATESPPKLSIADVVPSTLASVRHAADEPPRDRFRCLSRYARRAMGEHLTEQKVTVADGRIQWAARGDLATQVAACAAVTMLLDVAIDHSRPMLDCWQSMDGMQRLANAMLAFARHHERFPARASFDRDQRPLLSWRVHLLPFLGYQDLYERFRLDEPWNSPHNGSLIRHMPAVYQNPRRPCDYRTTYTVPVGPSTMFVGNEGLEQNAIHDGLGDTLMLVEADKDHAVYWTQPADLQFDPRNPWHGLGKLHDAGFLGARADGTVRLFLRSLDQYELRAYFTHSGGESQLHR